LDTADWELLLAAITGIAWTIVYINAIQVGFRQRTFAMPLAALALNFAWELTYSAVDLRTAVDVPTSTNVAWAVVEIVWAFFDVAIVYTFFKFGRAEFPSLSREAFVGGAVLAFVVSGVLQWLFIVEFGAAVGVRYSAFLQTVVMSATSSRCSSPAGACVGRRSRSPSGNASARSPRPSCTGSWTPHRSSSDWASSASCSTSCTSDLWSGPSAVRPFPRPSTGAS
jgi:hypothetical protein